MNYYPILIPTLNRYHHFKECVESLSRCKHADKTELIIGLDYPPSEVYEEGFRQIKSYIPIIEGFGKVTVFEHTANLGPGGNMRFLIDYCKKFYGAFIVTEDDNVFSPSFLDYMNQALDLFWDNERIITVSGYNDEAAYNQGKFTCYLSKDNCAWGIGHWFHKEEQLKTILGNFDFFKHVVYSRNEARKILTTYPVLYSMLNDMVLEELRWGDVMRTTVNIVKETFQLKPAISLVRNCGYDGSGVNCGLNDNFNRSHQLISNSFSFDFSIGVGPFDTEINRHTLYYYNLPKDTNDAEKTLAHCKRLYCINTSPFAFLYRLFRKRH